MIPLVHLPSSPKASRFASRVSPLLARQSKRWLCRALRSAPTPELIHDCRISDEIQLARRASELARAELIGGTPVASGASAVQPSLPAVRAVAEALMRAGELSPEALRAAGRSPAAVLAAIRAPLQAAHANAIAQVAAIVPEAADIRPEFVGGPMWFEDWGLVFCIEGSEVPCLDISHWSAHRSLERLLLRFSRLSHVAGFELPSHFGYYYGDLDAFVADWRNAQFKQAIDDQAHEEYGLAPGTLEALAEAEDRWRTHARPSPVERRALRDIHRLISLLEEPPSAERPIRIAEIEDTQIYPVFYLTTCEQQEALVSEQWRAEAESGACGCFFEPSSAAPYRWLSRLYLEMAVFNSLAYVIASHE